MIKLIWHDHTDSPVSTAVYGNIALSTYAIGEKYHYSAWDETRPDSEYLTDTCTLGRRGYTTLKSCKGYAAQWLTMRIGSGDNSTFLRSEGNMGWCSVTEVFDAMAKFILSTDKPDTEKREVLLVLAKSLEDNDWDCQTDSDYVDDPIVRSIFKELHPNWGL